MSLSEKVVLITGASSGIGAATAVDFARRGSWLALCGRNKDNLAATISSCLEAGTPADKVITLIGDLTGKEVCQKTISDVIGYFGRLDVLVNSAGIQVVGSIADLAVEDYDRQMDINVRSVFLLTQLAVPHLVKTKGNVVNVSSVAGLRSFPGIIAYNMSKAALDQMTRCAALELAAQGVRVNAVNPGVIVTEIHKRAGMSEGDYASFLERCKTTHALGRPGTPDEVAKSIVFLASDDASFITGVTLSVDGGRAVMCPR
ncbi:3-oxoacyl-[acyl-carrier-protein] reductase FabG-like isoform X2 [Bacillus rossius redtenbacheri]|uniref:3-oxoacyl-[acyl-carrier-protein] reductase FabG-like isoform X2 n=1 Tax=Bacillus rossius redtenbacheri TaxID=93214 RepID=UPI002FDEAC65